MCARIVVSGSSAGECPCAFLPARRQALLAHHCRDGVRTHPLARIPQVSGYPRRAVLAPVQREQAGDLGLQRLAALHPGRRPAVCPTCKTRTRTPPAPGTALPAEYGAAPSERRSARPRLPPHRVFHPEGNAAFEDIRLHCQLGVLRRSRASSARSSSSSAPLPSPRWHLSALTQLPSVPSLTPRSRATYVIGFPVSRTSRTAPSRKS